MDMMHLEHWPLLPDGTPEPPATLELHSGVELSMLEAFGIPAFNDYNRGLYDGLAFLYTGERPMWVYVPQSRLEEARELLNAAAAADEEENEEEAQ